MTKAQRRRQREKAKQAKATARKAWDRYIDLAVKASNVRDQSTGH